MTNQTQTRRRGESGQALVMVSVSLVAMIMILAFAVDLGWAFYVRKSAQAAADAAALAAVKAVDTMAVADPTKRWTCGGGAATCTPAGGISCATAPGGNLAAACLMAAQNKFTPASSWETVTVEASDAATQPPTENHDCGRDEDGDPEFINHPPNLHGVDTFYWVRVTVSHNIPVLFSAIFGGTQSLVSTRATAAAVRAEVLGSLILLNRGAEAWNSGGQDLTGVNLFVGGMGSSYVRVPGGIVLSSTLPNSGIHRSGWIQGGGQVTGLETSPDDVTTYLRIDALGNRGGIDAPKDQWHGSVVYRPDGRIFEDPFQDKGQPPISPSTTQYWPVLETKNGATAVLDGSNPGCTGGVCQPGNYFAVKQADDGSYYPTGDPVEVNSSLNFRNGALGSTDQKDFVFFGGLQMNSSGKGDMVVDFGSGRYVMAGVRASGMNVFSTANGVTLNGGTGEGSDPGRLVVLTDTSYDGLSSALAHVGDGTATLNGKPVIGSMPALQYGATDLQSGANDQSSIEMYGLDRQQVDATLQPFAPALIWQDRNNNVTLHPGQSPSLTMFANQHTTWGGLIYQPRGAWVIVHGGGKYEGALRIISGAMEASGSVDVTLTSPSTPLTYTTVALIE